MSAALKFGRGNKAITGMTSSEGEGFAFRSVVPVEGPVEAWMTAVEAEMRRTLAAVMKEGECAYLGCSRHVWNSRSVIGAPLLCVSAGVFNYAHTPRNKWIADCLGMVTLAGSQVWWTWETEDSFRQVREGDKHAMKAYAAKLTKQLAQLTGMVSGSLPHECANAVVVVAGSQYTP